MQSIYPFTFLDTLHIGIYLIDNQWRIRYVNNVGAEFLGKTRGDLLSKQIRNFFPEEGMLSYTQARRAMEQNTLTHIEYYAPHLKRWFETQYYPTTEGLNVLILDITQRKQTELLAQRQATLLELSTEAILTWRWPDPICYWNSGATRLYGFSKEEAVGQLPFSLLHTQFPEPLPSLYATMQRTGQWQGELKQIAKDGKPLVVECRMVLVTEDDGNQVILEINRDITERKALEQRKDEFINMASHELKTPVTTIKGLTQVLIRKLAQQGIQEPVFILTKMDAQIDRLTKLIDDLLNVSKIQAGRLDYDNLPVDMDTLVYETVALLQTSIPTHILRVSGATQAIVMGDKDRLGQVLTNLTTNAVKYSPQANRVDITLTRTHKHVQVAVRDYGIGIPKAAQQHIFERFYRVKSEKAVPGMGMGLYITFEIVKRHGGTLTVKSEEGKGSTFLLSLPLHEDNL